MFVGIFGWFVLSCVVGLVAENIGRTFTKYFLISLLLSPVIGLAILIIKGKSTKEEALDHKPHIFFCTTCNSAYGGINEEHSECPECGSILTETTILRDDWRSYSEQKKSELKKCIMRGQFLRNSQQSIPVSGTADTFTEIKHYKELLDAGVVTQEEFDQKKKQLLGL